ncbi:MAG TPA: response regulator transcription factor [Chloroflexia bacterium]
MAADSTTDYIAAGYAALRVGDWAAARSSFEAALSAGADGPEAHDGLGQALWWFNDIEGAHQQRTLAYLGFKRQGEVRRATAIAVWLAREQVFLNANSSAMKGWFARAERLLQGVPPCPEHGWLALMRASMFASGAELERTALQSLEIARQFDDTELEVMALAFNGLAQVGLGRSADGMACLDEAMVAATGGEVGNFMVISEVFCVTLGACELAGDLERTEHWCHAAADFARRHNCQFLSAYCRTTYGGLLAATGRWQEAEAELMQAIAAFSAGHRALRVHAVLKLADLRVSQGRLEEAQALMSGYEDYGSAVLPMSRLYLARGEAQLARAALEQTLRSRSGEALSLDSAPLLLLLVEVLLALEETSLAREAAGELADLARKANSDLLMAQAELAEGQVKRFVGEEGAADCFQSALDRLRSYEQSLVAGRAKLEMARLLKGSDWAGAVTWVKAALATFERAGAVRDTDEAARLLRELGVSGRPAPRLQKQLTQREEEVLALLARGLTNREIADRLFISAKTAEHHVSQILEKRGARSRAEAAAMSLNERKVNLSPGG